VPLDDLQKATLAVLLPARTPRGVFAGDSVLHRHGYRLSFDQDIFHAEGVDVLDIAERDLASLTKAGFTIERAKKYDGFVEAIVGTAERGWTKLQWVEAGSWSFFSPVPDPDYGYRLHIVDLAINKVLAAGGRREPRDFVDLVLIHRHIIPLWHALWAAPGKDSNWSPLSLAEQIIRKNDFHQRDFDDSVLSVVPLSASDIGATIREAIEEARGVFRHLPGATAGSLLVDGFGRPITAPALAERDGIRSLQAERGGGWPSGPAIDHLLIDGLIDRFGRDGAKLLAADGAVAAVKS